MTMLYTPPATAPSYRLLDPPEPGGLALAVAPDQTGTVTNGPAHPVTPPGPLAARFGQRLAYLLYCAVASLTVFILTMVLLPLGFGLMVLWVGFPILLLAFAAAHAHARGHRLLLRWLGHTVPDLPPAPPPKRGLWGWIKFHLGSADRWREVGLAIGGGLILAILGLIPFGWIQIGVMEFIAPWFRNVHGFVESAGSGVLVTATPGSVGGTVPGEGPGWVDRLIGIGLVAAWPFVTWGLSSVAATFARLFLTPSRRTIERRLADLGAAHEATAEAEAQSLRQIERDLHDGPQQRLIRTGMDLSAVQRRLAEGDVAAAQALLAEAQARTNETIQELRQIARGFAPPILAEKGLATALASLAGGSPVPARLTVGLADGARYSEPVERALYFAAAEGIANAAKHAGAGHVDLALREVWTAAGAALELTVRDDGRGGALPLPGHGLDGLRARVAGVEGTLDVASPAGGGTTLTVTVPVTQ
ncbi:MAG: sensor domain-containing protein [Propionibacteriaceae bacterium]|jgi:signal transduction histidine kinase|nr:sensor domain-containing protein [Propionibacteriaceae bacterium]